MNDRIPSHFVCVNGITLDLIVPPDYVRTPGVFEAAKDLGIYCSFIRSEFYASYDADIFKEALMDWGFYR